MLEAAVDDSWGPIVGRPTLHVIEAIAAAVVVGNGREVLTMDGASIAAATLNIQLRDGMSIDRTYTFGRSSDRQPCRVIQYSPYA